MRTFYYGWGNLFWLHSRELTRGDEADAVFERAEKLLRSRKSKQEERRNIALFAYRQRIYGTRFHAIPWSYIIAGKEHSRTARCKPS
jgi:hypothetical protein